MKRHVWTSLLLGYGLVIFFSFSGCTGAFCATNYENTVFPFPNAVLSYQITEKDITDYVWGHTDIWINKTGTATVTYTEITETTYKRTVQGIRIPRKEELLSSSAEFSLVDGDDFWIPPTRMENITLGETRLASGQATEDLSPLFGGFYRFKKSIPNYSIFNKQTVDVWETTGTWTSHFTKGQGVLVDALYSNEVMASGPEGFSREYTMNYTLASSTFNFSPPPLESQSTPGFEMGLVLVLLGTVGRFIMIHKRPSDSSMKQ
ncbi:MAG: hypothetical protein ACFFCQ_05480 [Promethearchaeota archaeon]